MTSTCVWLAAVMGASSFAGAKALDCKGLLNSNYARRAQATAAAIVEADGDESTAYGFVGVSDTELLTLLNTGKLKTAFPIRITTDHSAFANVKIAPVDWRAAARRAVQDARVRATVELLQSRATAGSKIDFQSLRTFLDHLPPPEGKSGLFTPSAPQITSALAYVKPGGSRVGGRDARQRLAGWLPSLDDLPAGAGARLVLSDRVMHRLSYARGEWAVSSIGLGDVVAIGPNSTAMADLLDNLTERARAAVQPAAERGT